MTKPRMAKQRGNDEARTYAWPPLPPHEFEVIGVTSAISAGLAKPYLVGWAAKVTAERAVDKYEFLGKMIEEDPKGALKWLKDARWASSGAKADRGTIVHGALEAYLLGVTITQEVIEEQLTEARVPKELWRATGPMIEGVLQFLDDEEPEVHWSESTVFSREHGYAGTPDIIAKMRIGGSLQWVVIDIKTSPRVYDETALQLVAYARADFVGQDDGTEAPLTPDGEPIQYGVVVRPDGRGKYEKVVFTLGDEELYDVFLACVTIASNSGVMAAARRPN